MLQLHSTPWLPGECHEFLSPTARLAQFQAAQSLPSAELRRVLVADNRTHRGRKVRSAGKEVLGAPESMGTLDPMESNVPAEPLRLLYVEDEPGDVERALRELKKSKIEFEVETVATREQLAQKLREKAEAGDGGCCGAAVNYQH